MGGLVAYESSEEDEDDQVETVNESKPAEINQDAPQGEKENKSHPDTDAVTEPQEGQAQPAPAPQETIIGPQIGPSAPGPNDQASYLSLEEPEPEPDEIMAAVAAAPGSSYSSSRATMRDLTLPTVPNLDIPPSPPGSPPAATSKKFEHFLDLKKKGVHFNSRIESSPAMRNPALTDKLLAFVELGSSATGDAGGSGSSSSLSSSLRDQYRTTLPPDLWDPTSAFPRHAFKEQLKQAQLDGAQARARGRGEKVEFVSTGTTIGGDAGQQPAEQKRKTRFDA